MQGPCQSSSHCSWSCCIMTRDALRSDRSGRSHQCEWCTRICRILTAWWPLARILGFPDHVSEREMVECCRLVWSSAFSTNSFFRLSKARRCRDWVQWTPTTWSRFSHRFGDPSSEVIRWQTRVCLACSRRWHGSSFWSSSHSSHTSSGRGCWVAYMR